MAATANKGKEVDPFDEAAPNLTYRDLHTNKKGAMDPL